MSADPFAKCEPDWIAASGYNSVKESRAAHTRATTEQIRVHEDDHVPPIMQTDDMKEFYLDIVKYGLHYAYMKFKLKDETKGAQFKAPGPLSKTTKPKNVVIVGAGLSGLAAGYELVRAGHHVKILEMQHRVGGRIKTVSKESFYLGLWSEGKHLHNNYIKTHGPTAVYAVIIECMTELIFYTCTVYI